MTEMPELRILDVHVDYNDSVPGILQVVKEVRPEWATNDIKIELLSGGSLNRLYRASHGDDVEFADAYVARIQTNVGDSIQRSLEAPHLQIGHAQKCCPPVFGVFEGGLLVGYSPGELVTWEDCYDDHIARHMVNILADLNGADISKMNFLDSEGKQIQIDMEPCIIPRMRRSLSSMPDTFVNYPERQEKFKKMVPSVATLEADINRIEEKLKGLDLSLAFAHNDVWVNNYIYNRKTDSMQIIDFEYAGFNYEGYDLGAYFSAFVIQRLVDKLYRPDETPKPDLPIPPSMKIKWCRFYLERRHGKGNVSEEHLTTFYNQTRIYDIVNQYFWALLIFTMADNERAIIDFLEFALIRYRFYLARREELFIISLNDPLPTCDSQE